LVWPIAEAKRILAAMKYQWAAGAQNGIPAGSQLRIGACFRAPRLVKPFARFHRLAALLFFRQHFPNEKETD